VSFIIGGADGLDREVVEGAAMVLSFSPLTWPHQLVRIMLAEQLYRAITIQSGHPYHRE
jgi:23S rRNA (pseudouridine1915-N3)-methyltransferase